MKKIFFILVCGSLFFLLTGCFVSELGSMSGKERIEYLKSIKPYGARWVKEGMTRESRKMDWVACGGEDDMKDHYERKSGLTNKEFFDGLEAYRNQLRACMNGKGYVYRNPSMPGVEDECNAGDCLHP
jgi:hypothetical protein